MSRQAEAAANILSCSHGDAVRQQDAAGGAHQGMSERKLLPGTQGVTERSLHSANSCREGIAAYANWSYSLDVLAIGDITFQLC